VVGRIRRGPAAPLEEVWGGSVVVPPPRVEGGNSDSECIMALVIPAPPPDLVPLVCPRSRLAPSLDLLRCNSRPLILGVIADDEVSSLLPITTRSPILDIRDCCGVAVVEDEKGCGNGRAGGTLDARHVAVVVVVEILSRFPLRCLADAVVCPETDKMGSPLRRSSILLLLLLLLLLTVVAVAVAVAVAVVAVPIPPISFVDTTAAAFFFLRSGG
jgi:hypothetical protein